MTRDALIIAHGQPSDPDGPEAEIAALAARVAADLPGWRIGGTTLAAPGGLEAALGRLDRPLLFPFFMADGWFLRRALPDRLAAAGQPDLPRTAPFGLLPETEELAAAILANALAARGWDAAETLLVCAAHGSGRSRAPADVARATTAALAARLGFRDSRTGFVEEAPFLAEALAGTGDRALCLPLFVARWGHVLTDLPEAAESAVFRGAMLPPLGTDAGVPALIARALAAAA